MFELANLFPLAIALFWAILYLQSGLDKVFDWSGNLSWLKGHFKESPLSTMVPTLLATLTVVEVAAGVLCAIGAVQIFLYQDLQIARYGLMVAIAALLMLFFGQRLAKDYEGAASIAMYFGVAILSYYLLS